MSANEGLYEDFYVRIGLDLDRLETGLANAGMTIEQNIRRLNHESNLIRLRSEVEITGLDETADAARILEIRQESLNRQMEIQRDRVRLLDAQLQHLTQSYGAESSEAQRTAIRLERARLSLANFEQEARRLTDTQSDTNDNLENLSDLTTALSPKLKAVAGAFTAVAGATTAAGKSVADLLVDFRELQNQAYELNMSVGKTRDFLLKLELGGGDIGDFEGYIRGITDAFVKGEADDPEFIALRKYGAVITDNTGRLKDFKDLTEEVYQAWKKAAAAGEGIEFLQLTGGESGIRDAIQFFERWEEAQADAARVMKANINDAQLHELDRAMNLVEVQAKELQKALGDIFVPAAQSAAEKFFQALHDGTEYLVENKDAIQRWGFIADEVFSTVADKVKKGYTAVGEFIEEAMKPKNTTGNEKVDNMMSGMAWRYGSAQTPYGVEKMKSGITEATESYGVFNEAVERAEKRHEEYNAELAKTAESLDTLDKQLDKNPLNQYAVTRIQGFKDELEDLRLELDFEDEFERARAQVDLWLKREIDRKNFLSDEEEAAIRELGEAKLEQIARAQETAFEALAEKAQQYWKDAADIEYSLTHTAFEKQLRDIELWKDAQQEKAETAEETAGIIANAAAKEAEAFEREVARIRSLTQTLEDEIFEMEHSRYEADMRRAMQKAQKALEDGVDYSVVQRWLGDKFGQFNKQAKESREAGGDYTKSPTGQVNPWLTTGAYTLQRGIGLMTDENQVRGRLISKLGEEAQAVEARIQAAKENPQVTMPALEQPTFRGAPVGDTTIIQGDAITQISFEDMKAELEKMQSQMQAREAEILPKEQATIPLETVVSPLNSISGLVEQILSAEQGRQPPQVNVSPNINIDLGGAYVFDNAMKTSLTKDITNEVASAITEAVQQATSTSNYSFGA